jgi:polyribonucleotide nucleotidyltransferase
MDMKVNGLDMGIMSEILARSKSGREKVLHEMEKIMKLPRKEISPLAPKIITLKVPVEKIREIIGPGGKIIKKIIFDTSADMQVEDDGTVTISADNMQAAEAARKMVEEIIADVEVGKIYKGKVMRIMNFGAFVEVLPGKEGLVHISHLAEKRVNKVEDVVSEGDELLVKCIEIDSQGRINLSHKEAIKSKSEKPK